MESLPEQRLLMAVVNQAVFDACASTRARGARKRDREEALEWIFSDDPSFGSFVWYMHLIGWDEGIERTREMLRMDSKQVRRSMRRRRIDMRYAPQYVSTWIELGSRVHYG